MGFRRYNGAQAMKQIYDDLGIYRSMEWHSRQDEDNVAHNWNRGKDGMEKIWKKLTNEIGRRGEWATDIKDALDSGKLSQERLNRVRNYYIEKQFWHSEADRYEPLGGIPGPPGTGEGDSPWEGDPEGVRPFDDERWDPSIPLNEPIFNVITEHPYQHPRTDDVKLDLADVDTFEGMTYAAPGREGEYQSGDDKGDLHPSLGTDIGAQAAYDLETRFIDELFGTEDRVYEGLTEQETIDRANATLTDKIQAGEVDDSYGLDLRRTAFPEDATEGTQAWYEHITRGDVDWAYYQNDSAYQAAYEHLSNLTEIDEDGNEVKVWRDVFDDQENITSAAEIRLIHRETEGLYEDKLIEGQGKDAWRYDWDGKYEPIPPPEPWVPTEVTVYEPGSGGTRYNTVDRRKVTPINEFQEAIFEPARPNINIPVVPIKIPDILKQESTPVVPGPPPTVPSPIPLPAVTQETQQTAPSNQEAQP